LSLAIIWLIPCSGAGGADRDFAMYANVGLSNSISPDRFNNFWGMGPSFGFESGFKFGPQITLGFFFEYDNFNMMEDKILQDAGLADSNLVFSGSDARFLVYGFSARWYLMKGRKGSSPYLMTGFAMVNIKKSNPRIGIAPNEQYLSNWGWSDLEELIFLGGGYDIRLSEIVYFFADVKMNIIYTDFETTQFALFRLGVALH